MYTACSYVCVVLRNVKNGDQVSSKADVCFLLCALCFSIEMYSEIKFVQCLMWQDFFDFQFWRTTFLATAREMSNGFLYFCGIWISEESPMRQSVGDDGILWLRIVDSVSVTVIQKE